MINWGKVPLASVLPFIFDTFDGGTGASITMTGLALGDILIYKGTSMTQRSSTAGFVLLDTDGIDIDTASTGTGIHGFSIDTGDNTDAGFFVAGSFYSVVVASVTIDAQTVSFVAGTFWLGPTLTVAGVDEVDVTHVAGTAQTAGDLAAMITAVDDLVDTEVGAIKTKTDFLPSVTAGAAGGLMIAGSNAATTFATLTVTGATTFTGNVAYSNGITITQATLNGHGISIIGNGTGSGINSVGGATGMGGNFQGGSTSGIGLRCYSTGAATTYSGFHAEATATNGSGMRLVGAGTGSALLLEPGVSGYGVNGSIQGDLSGSVGSVNGAVGSVTGDVGGNVVGSLGSLVANAINNNSIHSNACAKISDSGIQRGASNWENNSDDRSLAWAISKLVNKVDLNAAGDTLSIRKSNDSTALFTQAVTTSGGAAPVVSLDTTG